MTWTARHSTWPVRQSREASRQDQLRLLLLPQVGAGGKASSTPCFRCQGMEGVQMVWYAPSCIGTECAVCCKYMLSAIMSHTCFFESKLATCSASTVACHLAGGQQGSLVHNSRMGFSNGGCMLANTPWGGGGPSSTSYCRCQGPGSTVPWMVKYAPSCKSTEWAVCYTIAHSPLSAHATWYGTMLCDTFGQ